MSLSPNLGNFTEALYSNTNRIFLRITAFTGWEQAAVGRRHRRPSRLPHHLVAMARTPHCREWCEKCFSPLARGNGREIGGGLCLPDGWWCKAENWSAENPRAFFPPHGLSGITAFLVGRRFSSSTEWCGEKRCLGALRRQRAFDLAPLPGANWQSKAIAGMSHP